MLNIQHTLILIVILVIFSITFMTDMDGFGMSPGTLDQLASTSVHPQRLNNNNGMYLLF
jgi:hypothetical protein